MAVSLWRTLIVVLTIAAPLHGCKSWRFSIKEIRDFSTNSVQLAEFQLCTVTGTCPILGSSSSNAISDKSQLPSINSPTEEMLWRIQDGVVARPPGCPNPSSKFLDFAFKDGGARPTVAQFDYGATQRFAYYKIATANDCQNRDPISWEVSASLDGTSFAVVDKVDGYLLPDARFTWTDNFLLTAHPRMITSITPSSVPSGTTGLTVSFAGTVGPCPNYAIKAVRGPVTDCSSVGASSTLAFNAISGTITIPNSYLGVGTVLFCVTADAQVGDNYVLQTSSFAVLTIYSTDGNAIVAMSPTVISTNSQPLFSLPGAFPSPYTKFAFATNNLCGVTPIAQTNYATAAPTQITASLPAGVYSLCYSVANPPVWVQQGPTLLVVAGSSSVKSISPNVIGLGTTVQVTFNGALYTDAGTWIAFTSTTSCTGLLGNTAVTYNSPTLSYGSAFASAGVYKLCISVDNQNTWTFNGGQNITVVSPPTIGSVLPTTATSAQMLTLTLTGVAFTVATTKVFLTTSTDPLSCLSGIALTPATSNVIAVPQLLSPGTYMVCHSVTGANPFTVSSARLTVYDANSATTLSSLSPATVVDGSTNTFTFSGSSAVTNPAAKIGLAPRGYCASSYLLYGPVGVSSPLNGVTLTVPADFGANVNLQLCLASDGTNYVAQTNALLVVAVNRPNTVTAVTPNTILLNAAFSGVFTGPVATPQTFVALSTQSDCAPANRIFPTVYNGGTVNMATNFSTPIVLRVCYSIDSGNTWTLQLLPTVQVISDQYADVVRLLNVTTVGGSTSIPVLVTSRLNNLGAKLGLALPGECLTARVGEVQFDTGLTAVYITPPLTGASYVFCYQFSAITTPPWSEQITFKVGLTVTTASAASITAFSPAIVGVGAVMSIPSPANTISIAGVVGSPTTYFGFSNTTCAAAVYFTRYIGQGVTTTPISGLSIVMDYPGVFSLCYSTGASVFTQAVSVRAVAANAASVNQVTPAVIGAGSAGQLNISGPGLFPCATCMLALALPGNCSVARVNQVAYTSVGLVALAASVPGGQYRVCYSTLGASNFVEQTTASIDVVVATTTSITSLEPSIIGTGTLPQLNTTGGNFIPTAYIGFVPVGQSCSNQYVRVAEHQFTSNYLQMITALNPIVETTYSLCYTVSKGAATESWQKQSLTIRVMVAGPNSLTSLTPPVIAADYIATLGISGLTAFSGSVFAFAVSLYGCSGGPSTRVGVTYYTQQSSTVELGQAISSGAVYTICYSVDNGATWVTQRDPQGATLTLNVLAPSPTSMKAIIPAATGAGERPFVRLTSEGNPLATTTTMFAFANTSAECATGPRVAETPYTVENALVQYSTPLTLAGVYAVCFSTNGVSWVGQQAPLAFTVVRAANTSIDTFDPLTIGLGALPQISVTGTVPATHTFISFSAVEDNCNVTKLVGHVTFDGLITPIALDAPINNVGFYAVCYSTDNGATYVRQEALVEVIPAVSTAIVDVSPLMFSANVTTGVEVQLQVEKLSTSFVGFALDKPMSSNECETESVRAPTQIDAAAIRLSAPVLEGGPHVVCYSVNSGATWITQEDLALITIADALPTSVSGMRPNVVTIGLPLLQINFTGPITTPDTKLGFAVQGSGCSLVLNPVAYTLERLIDMNVGISLPGTFSVCYSVTAGATWVEQTNAALHVVDCDSATTCDACSALTYCRWCLVDNACGLDRNCTQYDSKSSVEPGETCPTFSAVTDSGSLGGSVTGGTVLNLQSNYLFETGNFSMDYHCRWLFPVPLLTPATVTSNATLMCTAPVTAPQTTAVLVELRFQDNAYASQQVLFVYYDCSVYTLCGTCNKPATSECGFCIEQGVCEVASSCVGLTWAVADTCPQAAPLIVAAPEAGVNGGAIAGVVIAVLAMVIAGVVFLIYYRTVKQKENRFAPPPLTAPVMTHLIYGTPRTSANLATILPHLSKFEQLLLLPTNDIVFAIAACTAATEADHVAKAFALILESHGLLVPVLKAFISLEVSTSSSQSTLFRTNSFATKMFKTYSKMVGLQYVHKTLGRTLNEAIASAEEHDIDMKKQRQDDQSDQKFIFLAVCQKVFRAIAQSEDKVPVGFRDIFHHLQQELRVYFPVRTDDLASVVAGNLTNSLTQMHQNFIEGAIAYREVERMHKDVTSDLESLALVIGTLQTNTTMFARVVDGITKGASDLKSVVEDLEGALDPNSAAAARVLREHANVQNSIAVGGFFFLRFLVPAMTAPESFGLVREPPNDQARAMLVMVGKVLQTMSNGKEFGTKEANMEKLNEFVFSNRRNMNRLFDHLSEVREGGGRSETAIPVPKEHKDAALVLLYEHVLRIRGKINENLLAFTAADDGAVVTRRRQMKLAFDLTLEEISSKVSGTELALASSALGGLAATDLTTVKLDTVVDPMMFQSFKLENFSDLLAEQVRAAEAELFTSTSFSTASFMSVDGSAPINFANVANVDVQDPAATASLSTDPDSASAPGVTGDYQYDSYAEPTLQTATHVSYDTGSGVGSVDPSGGMPHMQAGVFTMVGANTSNPIFGSSLAAESSLMSGNF